MQLNNLQSIILKDYAETLEKAIIHKAIDKVATLIAEDVSVSIYQKLLEQSTTNIQSCKDTSSCKDILCKNTSCKDTSCKDILSGKDIASCKDKNNTCQCCSEHNSTIDKMRKFNQRHKINKIKVNDQCINDNSNINNNINDNIESIKNDSIQDNFIKNDSLFDNISSSKNNSQFEYDLSNNKNDKNNIDKNDKNDNNNNNKNDIDKVDVILNKLIDILKTSQKTNSKASETVSKDELNELFKAAFALNEMCPFHHDEIFKAFFNFK